MKKILVVGSSGMLGLDLCEVLKNNYAVVGLDLNTAPQGASGPAELIKADITDKESISKVVISARPDAIIHAAAWTDVDGCEGDPDKAYKINALGSQNMAQLTNAMNIPFFYISTDFVFDGRKDSPYNEDDTTNPISAYGMSKLQGEELIKKSANKFFILRTSWLFGRWGKNFVDTIINKAKNEKTLKVVDDQIGSPTYTKDLALGIKAMVDLLSSRNSPDNVFGIYHMSNSGSCSWFEFAQAIFKKIKIRDVELLPVTSEQLNRPAKRPKMSVLDNSRYEKLTGSPLRPWSEALSDYLSLKR